MKMKRNGDELTWETSRGGIPTLADIIKATKKELPKVPASKLMVVASGFEGPNTLYRAIHVRPKTSKK